MRAHMAQPSDAAEPFRWKEQLDPPYNPVELRPELNPNYKEGSIEKAKAEAKAWEEKKAQWAAEDAAKPKEPVTHNLKAMLDDMAARYGLPEVDAQA